MTSQEALVALNMLPKIGPVRVRRLLEAFGDNPASILGAPKDRLMRVDGIGEETAKILHGWQDHADPATEIREAAERGISIVTQDDEDYPAPLRDAYDPPLLLYVWGKLEARDKHAISVVGSRRATHYGMQATKKLSYQIAQAGFTIISGLARGIDTAAHEAAVAANGRTIAVLGSGLAKLFPPENLALAEKIAGGFGAVVSEFPLHTSPDKQTFPDAQPHRRRLGAGGARRRVPGVVRLADHRESRLGIWQTDFRRARADRQADVRRLQPAHPRRCHARRRCQPPARRSRRTALRPQGQRRGARRGNPRTAGGGSRRFRRRDGG